MVAAAGGVVVDESGHPPGHTNADGVHDAHAHPKRQERERHKEQRRERRVGEGQFKRTVVEQVTGVEVFVHAFVVEDGHGPEPVDVKVQAAGEFDVDEPADDGQGECRERYFACHGGVWRGVLHGWRCGHGGSFCSGVFRVVSVVARRARRLWLVFCCLFVPVYRVGVWVWVFPGGAGVLWRGSALLLGGVRLVAARVCAAAGRQGPVSPCLWWACLIFSWWL